MNFTADHPRLRKNKSRSNNIDYEKKGREMTQSTPTEKSKKQQHKKRHQKLRLHNDIRTDLGRSVGVTTLTELVCLTVLQVANLPTNRHVIKRTHL